jgi:hypothetical protein
MPEASCPAGNVLPDMPARTPISGGLALVLFEPGGKIRELFESQANLLTNAISLN